MEVCGVVYLLIDGTNDCEYVGQTVQPLAKRFNAHASCKKTLMAEQYKNTARKILLLPF